MYVFFKKNRLGLHFGRFSDKRILSPCLRHKYRGKTGRHISSRLYYRRPYLTVLGCIFTTAGYLFLVHNVFKMANDDF
jgi:hypothetical protein